MHIHLHALIHFIRLLGISNVRFFGAMLLTLVFSLVPLDDAKTSSAMGTAEAGRHVITAVIDGGKPVLAAWRSAGAYSVLRSTGTDPAPQVIMMMNVRTGVFSRPESGIVMIPRMGRVPKPKSIYRNFARAPGAPSVEFCNCRGSLIHLSTS